MKTKTMDRYVIPEYIFSFEDEQRIQNLLAQLLKTKREIALMKEDI